MVAGYPGYMISGPSFTILLLTLDVFKGLAEINRVLPRNKHLLLLIIDVV